jgi:hypothetical protein
MADATLKLVEVLDVPGVEFIVRCLREMVAELDARDAEEGRSWEIAPAGAAVTVGLAGGG